MSPELLGVSLLPSTGQDDYGESQLVSQLRQSDTERIRKRIASVPSTLFSLFQSEIANAKALLNADVEDRAGAFFHVYRALEAYLSTTILEAALEALFEPVAEYLQRSTYKPRQVLSRHFSNAVRNAALEAAFAGLASLDLAKAVQEFHSRFEDQRHRTFHGFETPTIDQVEYAMAQATEIVEEIERVRCANF